MRKSSHLSQIEFDFSAPNAEAQSTSQVPSDSAAPEARVSFLQGTRSNDIAVDAATARLAGRANAANTSDREYKELHRERQKLLDKVMDETITKPEQNRLTYIEWALDRIADARHGMYLDELERKVDALQNLLNQIDHLRADIIATASKGRRK